MRSVESGGVPSPGNGGLGRRTQTPAGSDRAGAALPLAQLFANCQTSVWWGAGGRVRKTAVWGGGRTRWEDGGVATAFGGARRIEGKKLLQSRRAWDGVLIFTQHWHYNVIVVVWAGTAGGHPPHPNAPPSALGVSVNHWVT